MKSMDRTRSPHWVLLRNSERILLAIVEERSRWYAAAIDNSGVEVHGRVVRPADAKAALSPVQYLLWKLRGPGRADEAPTDVTVVIDRNPRTALEILNAFFLKGLLGITVREIIAIRRGYVGDLFGFPVDPGRPVDPALFLPALEEVTQIKFTPQDIGVGWAVALLAAYPYRMGQLGEVALTNARRRLRKALEARASGSKNTND